MKPSDAASAGDAGGGGRRWLWRTTALAALLGLGMAGYWGAKATSTSARKAEVAAVPSVQASSGQLESVLRVTGTVQAQNMISLVAPRILGSRTGMNRGGTDQNFGGGPSGGPGGGDFNLVLLTLAKPGSTVHEGETVAQFDNQNMAQRLDDYRDSVVQMEESVRKMVSDLAANKVTHDQIVASAKAAWDDAVLDLQTAPIRATIDAEKYKLAVDEAEATYKQRAYESPLVDESQQAQIRGTQLNLQQSKLELQRAEANLKKMTIKTPMNGIVVMPTIMRNGEPGQVREGDQVFPGQAFMEVVDPKSLILDGTVNQVDAERLRIGLTARIHMDAYPDVVLPGKVVGIGALAQISTFRSGYVGEIPIRIAIDRVDSRVLPDLTGNADVLLGAENAAATLPRAAVFHDDQGAFVFLKTVQGWRQQRISTGLENPTTIAVRSGLRPGDVVALARPM